MELKSYQEAALSDLRLYLSTLTGGSLSKSWAAYWHGRGMEVGAGVNAYQETLAGVPDVTMKVPTGGGKTFLACAALAVIFDALFVRQDRFVVWLVPSEAILTQTLAALKNPAHPYRMRLMRDFSGRVEVFTKEELLMGQGFSPDTVRTQVSIVVMSYASLRVTSRKKDVRKVYQENGQLAPFARIFAGQTEDLLKDTPEDALIQVMRCLTPVVIVDESHNAGSDLSAEMLANLNPSFILDLTATPRTKSNIVSFVDAWELKRENMVKLPVFVMRRHERADVLSDAVSMRGRLESLAEEEERTGGAYIRPLVLFQAQPKTGEESATFEKIRRVLVDRLKIPAEEVAVKTAEIDDLKGVDLLSRECPVRYIITVNALKEGWDCPFAYILASVANKSSRVDVEQILGRILRQPYARRAKHPLLNTAFVYTASTAFHDTLDAIVRGLSRAGFSERDYRIADAASVADAGSVTALPLDFGAPEGADEARENENRQTVTPAAETEGAEELAADLVRVTQGFPSGNAAQDAHSEEEDLAAKAEEFDRSVADAPNLHDSLGGTTPMYAMEKTLEEPLLLPRFMYALSEEPDGISLFGEKEREVTKEWLSTGFSLAAIPAHVPFSAGAGENYSVDLERGASIPKYRRMTLRQSQALAKELAAMPDAAKRKECEERIVQIVDNCDRYSTRAVRDYVKRVLEGVRETELDALAHAYPGYAARIADYIESQEHEYRKQQFFKLLAAGKIFVRERFSLASAIAPQKAISSIPKSLYRVEKDDMNQFEREVLDRIVALPNVRFWHRLIERSDFFINGFINHYPDFLIGTEKGSIVLVETKGDHLKNDDSREKLQLGNAWANRAGDRYRYFMVFANGADAQEAYGIEGFLSVLANL